MAGSAYKKAAVGYRTEWLRRATAAATVLQSGVHPPTVKIHLYFRDDESDTFGASSTSHVRDLQARQCCNKTSPSMARLMRAAQYDKENDKGLVHQIPIPKPEEDQLLVKITAASLCHSDLMISQRPSGLGLLTIGHEGVGVISKLHSSEGHGFRIGDIIRMICIIDACYECEGCRVHGSFCVGSRKGGAKIQGLAAHGYLAEYAVVDWRNAILLPGSLPVERMSPLSCAGITSFHAVDKCNLEPGQWLAIIGCGGLGQLAVRYAKAMGLRICCLDVNDKALETASQNGADATFNTQTDPKFVRKIRHSTQSRGCHATAVFSDAEAAYTTAQRILTFDGLLMVVGMPDAPLKFPAFAISTNLVRVKGASNGTAAEMKKAVDFTAKHHIIPDVQFRRLEEMPQMWWEMANGKAKGKLGGSFVDTKSRL